VDPTRRAPGARAAPPSRLRLALVRSAVLAACLALLCCIAYVVARQTSVFDLRTVDVSGAPAEVASRVEQALGRLDGRSLVSLDPAEAERIVERLPFVVAATADRDFPNRLRVDVRVERPVAVVRHRDSAWVVSARSRVLEPAERGSLPGLPRVWLPARVAAPAPGTYLLDDHGGALVRALARVPAEFPLDVAAARGTASDVVVVLRGSRMELRLGEAADLKLKLAVAATVLESLPDAERRALAYLDVSVPTRPVGAPNPQVERTA
jgi:cell division protein FtsQ